MMTTHEALVEVLHGLDLTAMSTHDLVTACRSELPDCTTEDVLEALREIVDELTARMEWMRSGKVTH